MLPYKHMYSHRKCSIKKYVLRISHEKFTGKHLFQSLFFNKNLVKRLWHRYFPMNFEKMLRIPFLQNTSGRLLLEILDNLPFLEILLFTI